MISKFATHIFHERVQMLKMIQTQSNTLLFTMSLNLVKIVIIRNPPHTGAHEIDQAAVNLAQN